MQLQQSGSLVAQQLSIVDPAWDAIAARAKYLEETFKTIFDQHTGKDTNQQPPTKARDLNVAPTRVLFCEELCEIAASQLPDLWRLGQAYFTGELRGINEPKPGNFKHIILSSIEQFCTYLRASILSGSAQRSFASAPSNIVWPNVTSSQIFQFLPWLPQCLRYVRISYATLIRLDLPSEVLDIIQKVIDQIRLLCLSTIFKKTVDKVKKIDSKETWKMGVPDFAGATMLPSTLEEIIVEMLEEGQSTCLKPEIRENVLFEPHSDALGEISQRVRDIMNAFCEVVENLAFHRSDDEQEAPLVSQLIGFSINASPQGLHLNNIDDKDWSQSVSWEQRLLCCLANCIYCNKIFFPHLNNVFTKHGYPISKLVFEDGRLTVNKLFNSILETYVEHKSDPLVGTIEPSMYIGHFQWDLVTTVKSLRPYAHECYDNLVGVYSEIFTVSPVLLRPVLEPIIQMVAEELARLMSCVQRFSANGALQANIDIRLIRDAVKLYSNETAKTFFSEALEAIPKLSQEGERQVSEILQTIKSDMKLQLMCFTIQNP